MFVYLKDNTVTHQDLHRELSRFATKDDLAHMNYDLKCYIDRKTADLAVELGDRIYRKDEVNKSFKVEVIDVFQKNSLAQQDQIKRMQDLV